MMKYVFISYHNDARDEALALRKALEERNIAVWMAPDDIPENSNYTFSAPSAIENCKVFVPILSPQCYETVWMTKELDTAVNSEKIILPYLLEGQNASEALIFYLADVEKFRDMDTLLETIKSSISRKWDFFYKKWLDGGPYKKLTDKEEFLPMNIITLFSFVFAILTFAFYSYAENNVILALAMALIILDLIWYTCGKFIPLLSRIENRKLTVFLSILLSSVFGIIYIIAELIILILVADRFM